MGFQLPNPPSSGGGVTPSTIPEESTYYASPTESGTQLPFTNLIGAQGNNIVPSINNSFAINSIWRQEVGNAFAGIGFGFGNPTNVADVYLGTVTDPGGFVIDCIWGMRQIAATPGQLSFFVGLGVTSPFTVPDYPNFFGCEPVIGLACFLGDLQFSLVTKENAITPHQTRAVNQGLKPVAFSSYRTRLDCVQGDSIRVRQWNLSSGAPVVECDETLALSLPGMPSGNQQFPFQIACFTNGGAGNTNVMFLHRLYITPAVPSEFLMTP